MSAARGDEWLARLRAQDHEAFDDFVREHHAAALRLAQRLLRHREDALEAVQESFLAAYEGIARFAERATLKTWLLSITYRKCVDRLQRRTDDSVQIGGMLDDDALWKIAHSVQNLTDWSIDPEQTYRDSELAGLLEAALGKLPSDSRAVFELRDLQGLSSRETAAVLDLNEGAVRVRLHRVRQFLMHELQAHFGRQGGQR